MKKQLITLLGGAGILAATLWIAWICCHQERPETVNIDSAPVTVSPSTAKSQMDDSSLVEFQRYIETLATQIPGTSDLKDSDFEVHSAPRAVLQFAPKLAHVHDVMRADSRNISTGLRFFQKCALDDNALVTIRAVCFRMFRRWDSRSEIPVSDEIATLSRGLPGDDL